MIALAEARGLASDTTALARALDGVPVAIAIFDRDLRLVRTNERFRVLTGCPGGSPSLLAPHEIFPTSLAAIGPALTAAWRGAPYPPIPVRFARAGGAGTTAEVSIVRLPETFERGGHTEDGLLFVATELGRWAMDAPAGWMAPDATVTDTPAAAAVTAAADTAADAEVLRPVSRWADALAAPPRHAASRTPTLPPSLREASGARRALPREMRHDLANVLDLLGNVAHLLTLRADDPDAVRAYAARIAGAVERGTEIIGGAADVAAHDAPLRDASARDASARDGGVREAGVRDAMRSSMPSRPSPAAPGRHVLVVEDDDSSRDLMTAILESRGHHVRAVPGVTAALEVLERHAPGAGGAGGAGGAPVIEVLVTDVGLEDGSGWELAATARVRWPRLRVGVVTGWDAATDPGIDTDFVLRKPLRLPELLACVAGDEPGGRP